MIFIFWQGIISIHQKTFLEAVSRQPGVEKVILVVEQDITPYRKKMGWDAPVINNVTVIRSPLIAQVKELVRANKNALHIMGGIRVGPMLTTAFDDCIRLGCRLAIMTEPYNDEGLKGKLRTLKYQYYRLRYFRHINFVLAIGRQGVHQYTNLGFPPKRIFPWAYFVSIAVGQPKKTDCPGDKRIIYAGRLEAAKGIYRFVEELLKSEHRNYRFDIYGEGPDEEKLRSLIAGSVSDGKITIRPFLKYEELLARYAGYDWVVLPSAQKDGWGVIVSEGLLNGLCALCSSICGVSRVIRSGYNGEVFDWQEVDGCRKAIDKMLTGDGFAGVDVIREWAGRSISGETGAEYFMRIVDSVYENKQRPLIPWE